MRSASPAEAAPLKLDDHGLVVEDLLASITEAAPLKRLVVHARREPLPPPQSPRRPPLRLEFPLDEDAVGQLPSASITAAAPLKPPRTRVGWAGCGLRLAHPAACERVLSGYDSPSFVASTSFTEAPPFTPQLGGALTRRGSPLLRSPSHPGP